MPRTMTAAGRKVILRGHNWTADGFEYVTAFDDLGNAIDLTDDEHKQALTICNNEVNL